MLCHLVLEYILKLILLNIHSSLFPDIYPLICCLLKTYALIYSPGRTPGYTIPRDLAHCKLFLCGLVTWMTGWLDMKSLAYSFFIDFLKNILLISLVSALFSYPYREFVTLLKGIIIFYCPFFFFLTRLIFKAGCFWLIGWAFSYVDLSFLISRRNNFHELWY